MKKKGKYIYEVKYNSSSYVILLDNKDPEKAIRKARAMADRDLTDPDFVSCEYFGQEDV